MKKERIKFLVFFVFIFVSLAFIIALSGSGTSGDPYLIHNWTELNEIRNDLSANYKLVANLSASDLDYLTFNSGTGWNPIGNDTNPFTGTFDGDGNTISYLYISKPSTNYIGLFGYTNSTSNIYDLGLNKVDINGYAYVGSLVGFNNGNISRCYSTGDIKNTFAYAGGLLGFSYGFVNNTYSTVNVETDYYGAGLISFNYGYLNNSYSIGNVTGGSTLRGFIYGVTPLTSDNSSYYNMNTSGKTTTGFGEPRNTTQMSVYPYNSTYIGWDFITIWKNSLNVFDNQGNSGYPSLIFQSEVDNIKPKYYSESVNNTKASFPTLFKINITDNYPLNPNGYYIFSTNNSGVWVNDSAVNFTLSSEQINATKTLNSTSSMVVGYKWYIFDNNNNSEIFSSYLVTYSQLGSGTSENPYLIYDWNDLYNIRNNLASNYKLMVNLSSSTYGYITYNSGTGWTPIGINFLNPFLGKFNGNYNTISDLIIDNSTATYKSLFGYQSNSVIKNLGVLNASITASDYSAVLVSRGTTNITNVYVTGKVNGSTHNYIGGMVASFDGHIKNSYARVNVTGNQRVGGLVGYETTGNTDYILNSYSAGNVTCTTDCGGLIGTYSFYSTSKSSFYDTNISGQSDTGKGTAKNTTKMKTLSEYILPSVDGSISFLNGDFEWGNLTNWNTGGNKDWVINDTAFEGSSAKAGNIYHNQLTWINRSLVLLVDTYLNFYWKVSSEATSDFLIFCLNSSSCTIDSGYTDRISGSIDWNLKTYNLSAGTYLLHWAYGKDGSVNTSMDTGWLDNIYFTSTYIPGLSNSWDFGNLWNINPSINEGYPYLDFRGINITLSPSNGNISGSFLNTFNCSASSLYTLNNITFLIWASNGTLLNSNKTTAIYNYSIFEYTLPSDGTYYWTCEFLDSESNSMIASNNTIHINTIAPAINLIHPENNEYFNYKNIDLNFTAVDSDNVSMCQLWANFSGTWSKNYTINNPLNLIIYNHSVTMSDNKYRWNVWCNDTYNNAGFSSTNYTVTIDTINPISYINSISTTNNSQTISFNSSATDTNIGNCKYTIYNDTGEIDGLNNNISMLCNSNPHSATVTHYGNFTLRVYSIDKATNENYTELNFTTSQVNGTTIILGGGGAGTIKELATNFTITSVNLQNSLDNGLAKDSKKARSKPFLLRNKGIDPITVTITCSTQEVNISTRNVSICDYVTFSETTFIVPPNEQANIIGYVNVLTPENSSLGDVYYFNIIATSIEGDTEKISKLSVSNRVTFLSYIYKWSFLPSFGEEKRVYPVSAVAIFFSILFFIIIFIMFNRAKMPLTGFLVSIGISSGIFFTWLLVF